MNVYFHMKMLDSVRFLMYDVLNPFEISKLVATGKTIRPDTNIAPTALTVVDIKTGACHHIAYG
jgi:hypothetical protein